MVKRDSLGEEDDFLYKFDVCQEMLDWQSKFLDRQSQMIDRQSQMIDRQAKLLDEQARLLVEKDRKMAQKLYASGDSIAEIAEFLNIDPAVVESYIK